MKFFKGSFFIYTSFFYLPKRRSKKRAPSCTGPAGYPALLAVDGTLKTHRLRRLRQVQRLIPPTAVMLSGTEWAYKFKLCFIAISRCRAEEQRTDQRLGGAHATFRCRPFFVNCAGKSAFGGPSERLPFLLVRFLWASKENEHKKYLSHVTCMA
jgi:hypothetical protein